MSNARIVALISAMIIGGLLLDGYLLLRLNAVAYRLGLQIGEMSRATR